MSRKKNKIADAAEDAVKKSHPAILFLAVLFLLIGLAAGAFVCSRLTGGDKLASCTCRSGRLTKSPA